MCESASYITFIRRIDLSTDHTHPRAMNINIETSQLPIFSLALLLTFHFSWYWIVRAAVFFNPSILG